MRAATISICFLGVSFFGLVSAGADTDEADYYRQYSCGSKQPVEDAVSVSDTHMRMQNGMKNQCMCGFLQDDHTLSTKNSVVDSEVECINGFAGEYPCSNVNLMSYMNAQEVNGPIFPNSRMNDIWGWTDPQTDKEYAIVCTESGTSFVDVSEPTQPLLLGKLPAHSNNFLPAQSFWRDVKTYKNHAFIVSESDAHGMQVFDLTQLRGLDASNTPEKFKESAHYRGFGNAHNVAINEDTGYAIVVGNRECKGFHMIDISEPLKPEFAGCYDDDGYTHDVQCVVYKGSDTAFTGREICFASNEDTVTIVDVTDKANPVMLSRTGYTNSGRTYTHQGWLTEDQGYFLFGDETDELKLNVPTTTHVMNVKNLASPRLAGTYTARTSAVDHNQYVKDNFVYQANYRAGLRILELTDIANARLTEVGFFDIFPGSDAPSFNGAWSTYPYFPSGNIIVSGIEQGLFVLRRTGRSIG